MRSTRANLLLAGTLSVAALTGGAVVGPAIATAASGGSSPAAAVGNRIDKIKQTLQGLVDNGTITTEQRDKVATTLNDKLPPPGARGRGGARGVELGAAAKALGMTAQDLMTELRASKSLADVAGEKKVPLGTLTGALQKAAEDQLASAVKTGRLTQAQADKLKSTLSSRIADQVQRKGVGPGGGPGRGHGRGPGMGPGAPGLGPGAPGMGPGAPDDATPGPGTTAPKQPSSYLPA